MQPSVLLLILVAAAVHGHRAANTPAAQFWEQALPTTPMPDTIADLVQRVITRRLWSTTLSPPGTANLCIIYKTNLPGIEAKNCLFFFHKAQFLPGSTITASFPAEEVPPLLTHDLSEKVPFEDLNDVLAAFNIPAGSTEAARVAATLSSCQAPPLAGELKSCTTSLESTVRSAMAMLGVATDVHGVSALPATGLPRRPYVVQAVTKLDGDQYVACHAMPFPYAVYQCHMSTTELSSDVYMVSLRGGGDGALPAAVDMLAFCHLDTSSWNPAHPAFELLRTSPGGSPVCHFMPHANLVFVKKTDTV
ncbi:hypothetical protein QOZ80_5AG0397010 [Eleusine coracana subsp. coracana]|nr:hypothetical protein QOZ80_5AG0397010 [Eleusine coracana subsp. coracana]